MLPTLSREERTLLVLEIEGYELRELPEIEQAMERQRYDDAQQTRREYEALFRFMDDLHAWDPTHPTKTFPLSMPADQLGRLLRRMIRNANRRLIRHVADGVDPRHDSTGKLRGCAEIAALCCDLLDQLALAADDQEAAR